MDLAMAIPNDEYFIRNLLYKWRMQETEMTAFSDKVKQLIAMVRQRLLMLSNHSEEEYQLRKIFNSFDLNLSGSITIDELSAMLAKLGILFERKYTQALLDALDSNGNGRIEFDEFATFILYDPYK